MDSIASEADPCYPAWTSQGWDWPPTGSGSAWASDQARGQGYRIWWLSRSRQEQPECALINVHWMWPWRGNASISSLLMRWYSNWQVPKWWVSLICARDIVMYGSLTRPVTSLPSRHHMRGSDGNACLLDYVLLAKSSRERCMVLWMVSSVSRARLMTW